LLAPPRWRDHRQPPLWRPIFAAIGRYKGAAVVRMGEIASMLFDNPAQGLFIFVVTHLDDMLQDLRKRYYAESFQPSGAGADRLECVIGSGWRLTQDGSGGNGLR
jgi:hypothetical protein